ncbi:MAG: DNA repair protein RadA [Spirochaetes bacterium]|nr:DNA repair protein RadA [Spirochaetota bacterium]
MKKEKTRYLCDNCGHEEPKWAGRCPACLSWNSFSEISVPSGKSFGSKYNSSAKDSAPGKAISIAEITADNDNPILKDCGIEEINRVLGGGIVSGSVILIGGEPGIGKSTLMMQLAQKLSAASRSHSSKESSSNQENSANSSTRSSGKVLYVSGEESQPQIRLRANRLGNPAQTGVQQRGGQAPQQHDASANAEQEPASISETSSELIFLFSSDIYTIKDTISNLKPETVIVDSIQTLFSPEAGAVLGTINQLKYCCQELIGITKLAGTSLFLIAHVTKEGIIAGPKSIEHMVDTVLYFEHSENEMRILRAVKNRFGSIDELALFKMDSTGLQQITSPENSFLIHREKNNPPGICIAAIHEGSRVFLVEIQALTVPAKGGLSRVFSDRIDSSRISRIAAVLEKQTGVRFSDQDIYINVAGGMKIKEVGVDLPAALALYSSRTGIPINNNTAAIGELSLTGEIRPVPFIGKRLKSASSCGIKEFYSSKESLNSKPLGSKHITAETLTEIIKIIFK